MTNEGPVPSVEQFPQMDVYTRTAQKCLYFDWCRCARHPYHVQTLDVLEPAGLGPFTRCIINAKNYLVLNNMFDAKNAITPPSSLPHM